MASGMTTPRTTPTRASGEPGLVEKTDTGVITHTELARPWKVIVWDDPITLMVYVTMVFQKLFGYPYEKARRLMMEVHTQGRALVWTGAREEAEHYVFRLHSHQLLATLEPVEE